MQTIKFTTVKRGRWSKKQSAKSIYVDIHNDYKNEHITNDFAGQIAVQSVYSKGTGADYKEEPQPEALINITFPDKSFWSGSFQKLQDILQGGAK